MEITKAEILARTNLFENISDKSRNALADICLSKQVSKKQHLFLEDDKGVSLYILVTGSIQLYKTSTDGKDIVIRVIKPGEIFGEVILFEQDHYPVSAVALKDSFLYVIPKHQFIGLLKNEDFSRDFFGTLMKKMRYLAERIKYLTVHDVEDRLRQFLEEHHGRKETIVPTISKKDIASSIGATPETFSRLINRLKKEGKMEWKNNSITVFDSFWE
jgi:CRP/FNR family transcriptional regulator